MLTYNREDLVAHAIKSILNQTFVDFEFIIVDNGSTDSSGAIADEFAKRDKRIRVIHRERGNIGSGRNAGLDSVKGEFITFIDDDDWCEPDFLEFLYNLALEKKADVSICGALKEDGGIVVEVGVFDDILVMDTQQAIIELLWRKRFNTGFPTKLIDTSLFKDIRFDEVGQYDDIHLMYKILANAKTVVSFGQPKYHVTRHNNNNSLATVKDGFITPEYLDIYRKAYRQRTLWLCTKFPLLSDYWWYFDSSFQISMVNKIISNNLKDCDVHLFQMRQELKENREKFLNSQYVLDFERDWMIKYV